MDAIVETEAHFLNLLQRLRRLGPGQPPFEEVDISSAQLGLIEWVAAAPGCSLQDLAAGLALTAPTVSVAVRRLEEAGLLERRPDPQDRRALRLFLTEAAVALVERVARYRHTKAHRLLASLAPEEQRQLLALLERALSASETQQP
jgi:DNA-binding MarR family transcriptional regulator